MNLVNESEGCVDLAVKFESFSSLEGPIYLSFKKKERAKNETKFVKKCCDFGQSFDVEKLNCTEGSGNWMSGRNVRDWRTLAVSNLNEFDRKMSELSNLSCNNDEEMISVKIPVYILTNGSAVFQENGSFKVLDYKCLNQFDNKTTQAILCSKKKIVNSEVENIMQDKNVFVPKCCGVGEVYSQEKRICIRDYFKFLRPRIFDELTFNLSNHSKVKVISSFITSLNNICFAEGIDLGSLDNQHYFFRDGQLFYNESSSRVLSFGEFCFENSDRSGPSILFCKTQKWEEEQELCSHQLENFESFNKKCRFVYTILGCVSLVFLCLTLFFYVTLPKLKNTQGKIVISSIFAIIFTTSILIVLYNSSVGGIQGEQLAFILSPTSCTALGYLLYFAGLTKFSWMSVLCFDLYWTFGKSNLQLQNEIGDNRFFYYSFVAYGIPLTMTAFLFLVDTLKFVEIIPNVGVSRCFLSSRASQYYFYLPIFVLLCFNTLMFLQTITTLYKGKKQNRIARQARITHHRSCQSVSEN
jgi:uncharacterized membrane protein